MRSAAGLRRLARSSRTSDCRPTKPSKPSLVASRDGRSARACPCRHLSDGAERDALGLREHDIRDPPLARSQGRAVVLDSLGSGHGTDVTMT
jgi:hypothetical protein